ncbi:MAG: Gfo/Idh/MocA family oxidoreductase, partial [Phycisphaeraceae bacterium]
KPFSDGMALMRCGEVDAITIATPHGSHPPLAMAAFEQGLHVLTEKPIAVTAKAAQEMIDAAAAHPQLIFAAMFQMRAKPTWQAVKRLIDIGVVGELVRIHWTITTWFRSQAYYDSAGWRATWKGEGGGLLINQCPHNLDLFQWFAGMPSEVTAQVSLGKYHDIEVEDEVIAVMRFANGASGTFVASSGEAPGVNHLEIVGDRATLVADADQPLKVFEHHGSVAAFRNTTSERFARPTCDTHTLEPGGTFRGFQAIIDNFVSAIRDGEPLIAPAAEGIHGLELGNAMLMSGLTGKPVALPSDRDAYDALLQKLIDEAALTPA